MKKLFLILLVLAPMVFPQTVAKVASEFVIVDTNQGLGEKGDTIVIFRKTDNDVQLVGFARIVLFREGKTAAKMIKLEPGKAIKPGDRALKMPDSMRAPESEQTRTAKPAPKSNITVGAGWFSPVSKGNYYSSGLGLGLSSMHWLRPRLPLNIEVGYGASTMMADNVREYAASIDSTSARVTDLNGSMRFFSIEPSFRFYLTNPHQKGVSPFLQAGGGLAILNTTVETKDDDLRESLDGFEESLQLVGGHVGVGFQFRFPSLAFDLSARYSFLNTDFDTNSTLLVLARFIL